jgi:uncharacterized membrane protein
MIDGVQVPFTAEEEAAKDAEEAAWDAGAPARAAEEVQDNRRSAYQAEADHLHFEEQANEVAAGTWTAKRAEIKARFPK